MKKFYIVISVVIVILSVLIFMGVKKFVLTLNSEPIINIKENDKNSIENKQNTITEEKPNQEEQKTKNSVQTEEINTPEDTSNVTTPTTPNKPNNEVQNNSVTEQAKTPEPEKNSVVSEPKQEEIKQPTVTETPSINTDDITPMYSWERVDFKMESECLAYGDSYEPYLNGEVTFNCRIVNSKSGKLLGYMFDTEKLN